MMTFKLCGKRRRLNPKIAEAAEVLGDFGIIGLLLFAAWLLS